MGLHFSVRGCAIQIYIYITLQDKAYNNCIVVHADSRFELILFPKKNRPFDSTVTLSSLRYLSCVGASTLQSNISMHHYGCIRSQHSPERSILTLRRLFYSLIDAFARVRSRANATESEQPRGAVSNNPALLYFSSVNGSRRRTPPKTAKSCCNNSCICTLLVLQNGHLFRHIRSELGFWTWRRFIFLNRNALLLSFLNPQAESRR